ncbi:MAG: HEAT repeat domain-containing protein [Limisphaerales bacterium]
MPADEQGRSAPNRRAALKFNVLAALFAITCVQVLWLAKPTGPPQPEYGGRTLTQWLELSEKSFGDPSLRRDYVEAIRKIGTNGIPLLLQMIQAPEEPWRTTANIWFDRLKLTWVMQKSADWKIDHAETAFEVLGPRAKSALPELLAILKHNHTSRVRLAIIRSIFRLGPTAEDAIPDLIIMTRSSHWTERYWLCSALGQIGIQPDLTVPVLTDQLQDPDRRMRRDVLLQLKEMTTNAASATPVLVTLLTDPDFKVRETATNALLVINPEAAIKSGIKYGSLPGKGTHSAPLPGPARAVRDLLPFEITD